MAECKKIDIALSGTSATLVIQTKDKIYIGWVGDSAVVLVRKDKKVVGDLMTVPEHTPLDYSEKIRIYNHRGETRASPLDKKMRIYVRARMYPGLSISRSLGDVLAHHIGVTSEPDIKIHKIEKNDKFIVLGTDGIWDNLLPGEVAEIVNEYGTRDPGTSSEFICQKVKDICINDGSFLDDMTIVVSHIK
jgi:serine/threonine protein phosphatase PrpC